MTFRKEQSEILISQFLEKCYFANNLFNLSMEHSTTLKSVKKVKSSGTVAQGNFLVRSYLTFGAIEAKIFTLLLAGIDKEDKNLKRIEFLMSLITNYKGGSAYEVIHEASETYP